MRTFDQTCYAFGQMRNLPNVPYISRSATYTIGRMVVNGVHMLA